MSHHVEGAGQYGFILYASHAEAVNAMVQLNGQVLGGKSLKCAWAQLNPCQISMTCSKGASKWAHMTSQCELDCLGHPWPMRAMAGQAEDMLISSWYGWWPSSCTTSCQEAIGMTHACFYLLSLVAQHPTLAYRNACACAASLHQIKRSQICWDMCAFILVLGFMGLGCSITLAMVLGCLASPFAICHYFEMLFVRMTAQSQVHTQVCMAWWGHLMFAWSSSAANAQLDERRLRIVLHVPDELKKQSSNLMMKCHCFVLV